MITKIPRNKARKKRHDRLRKKVLGSQERPRLNVFKSLRHIYAQVIDDSTGRTLVSASTLEPEQRAAISNGGNIDAAKAIGKLIAEKSIAAGITKVVFDRGGYIYHGRVKALADAAREAGLDF